jgi:sugar phosphate isomerase/epimerase
MPRKIELLAGYWTIAGDCYAMGPSEVSPFPLRERVEAASAAGYRGLGLVHQDLVFNAKAMGYPAMKRLFDDHGIAHIEVEFLGDWFEAGAKRKASDHIRKDLLEAAMRLAHGTSNVPARCGPSIATYRTWATPSRACVKTHGMLGRRSRWKSCP